MWDRVQEAKLIWIAKVVTVVRMGVGEVWQVGASGAAFRVG